MPLRQTLVHAGWEVELTGRADVVREPASGPVRIEELKTVWADSPPAAAARRRARRQVRLYARMWSAATGRDVDAELVWLPIGEGSPERERLAPAGPAFEEALRRALDGWVARGEDARARRAAAAGAAAGVALPYPAWRPGQEPLARAVAGALDRGEQLLVEAPTGSGKTAAVLVPALRHALATGRRLLVVTPTGLQQRGLARFLRRIAPPDLAIGVRLDAKARLCANDTMACHESTCPFARDYGAKREAAGLPARAFASAPVLEPDGVREAALDAGLCPFELSLDAAALAPVTVGDLNHAFDPVARILRPEDADDVVLVVDEVHRLADRVRQAWSVALEHAALHAAREACRFGGAPLHAAQEAWCADALVWLRDTVRVAAGLDLPPTGDDHAAPRAEAPASWEMEHPVERETLADLLARGETLGLATLAYRHATRAGPGDDPFLAAAGSLRRLADALASGDDACVTTVGVRDGAPFVRRLCVDPAPVIAPLLARCHAFVGLSATLAPAELTAEVLGLDPARAAHVRIPDPFDPEHRRLVIDPDVDTRREARQRHTPAIARRLVQLAEAVPGVTLALLPSHAWLARVREALPATGLPVHAQPPGADPGERLALLAALDGEGPALWLAVAGGVFGEGVELPPGRLRAVAVVGPCLPPADLERRLLARAFEERLGRGFEAAFAGPGMVRVVQAGGRLLRGPDDRGVIALLGRRFLREPYRSAIPEAWLGGAAPEECVGDPAGTAAAFFGGDG